MRKAKLIDGIQFFKTLSFKKLLNGFLLRTSYFITKHTKAYVHWGQPEFLSIEPTNLCNLSCPECPSGTNNLKRAKLFLSLSDYKEIIDKTASHLSYLQLFFQGEPFMHPKIFEFIEYATSRKIYTCISTNGQFLNQKNCKKIISSGLHQLIVSLDGTTQGIYEKYRVGGSLNKAIQGISDLVKLKNDLPGHTPYIILQFVIFKHNEHQIPEVKKLAEKLGVQLHLKTAQINDLAKASDLLPGNIHYSRYTLNNQGDYVLNRVNNHKCKRIWTGSVISAENQLLPCCFDKKAEHPYSNKGEGIGTWKSKPATKLRKQVWANNTQIEMCRNCLEGTRITIKKA